MAARTAEASIRRLGYFVAVAEERSFTRASERLLVAQPALSQQIRLLERGVGGPLFHRTTRSVTLTEVGEVLLEHARVILAAAERGMRAAQRAACGDTGELTIAFSGTSTYDLMPLLARSYANRQPDVRVHLRGEVREAMQVDGLLAHEIDVAVARSAVEVPSGIEMRLLRQDPLVALLPESHRLAGSRVIRLAEMAHDRFITESVDETSGMYAVVERACAEAGFIPDVGHEVSGTASLVSLVAAGLGVAVVPSPVRHLRIPGAVYRPLEGCDVAADVQLLWRENERCEVVLRCIDIARELVGNVVVPFGGAPLD